MQHFAVGMCWGTCRIARERGQMYDVFFLPTSLMHLQTDCKTADVRTACVCPDRAVAMSYLAYCCASETKHLRTSTCSSDWRSTSALVLACNLCFVVLSSVGIRFSGCPAFPLWCSSLLPFCQTRLSIVCMLLDSISRILAQIMAATFVSSYSLVLRIL